MDAGPAASLLAWLDAEGAVALDPTAAADLRRTLGTSDLVSPAPHGGWTCWQRLAGERRRRLLELDRSGNVVTWLRWTAEGALAAAWMRIPPAGFVGIETGAGSGGPRGDDVLRFAEEPHGRGAPRMLGGFAALAYDAIEDIPVLPEPGRLPPHAGTAVLNLLAALAEDAGRAGLAYRGPYPTESLFLALLESFRFTPEADDPLALFMRGGLQWQPAPHARWFTPEGVYVQRRARVEKVVWRGRAYYRPDWQRVARHAPRRVHDAEGGVHCSLWALGRPLETHLRLDAEGHVQDIVAAAPALRERGRPLEPAIARGVEEVVLAQSAPALGSALREVMRALAFEWGPVDGDLVAAFPQRVRMATRLRDAHLAVLRAAPTREGRLALALAAVIEIAALAGDALRARAQARLLARPEAEQAEAFSNGGDTPSAPAIAAAAEALAATALTGDSEEPR